MIKTIILDIGNVLIYFDGERMLRQVSEVCGISFAEATKLYVHQELGILYEKGIVSSSEFHEHFRQIAKKPFQENEFWNAFTDIFSPHLEMEEAVLELKKTGKPLLLLSNTCEAHYSYLCRHFKFLASFDHPILSFEIGARKPERALFDAALKIANCKPEECFYTDDVAAYVEAARKLGIQAETYTTAAAFKEVCNNKLKIM